MGTNKNTAMPGGLTVELKGMDKALAKLDMKKISQDIEAELHNFGALVKVDAITLVPVDEGHLKQSIFFEPKPMAVEIGARADYAAYVEFGTRKFAASYVASLPSDWQGFAAQYKGPGGGSFEQFVMDLVRWCRVHGIDEKAAYPIARKILINGTRPQPYLYPAFEKNKIELIKNLKKLLNA